MPVESADDRAVFLDAAEFGAEGVYTPFGGAASAAFAGVFDRPSIAAAMGEASVLSIDARPTFCCRESDLPDGAAGDASDQIAVTGEGTFEVISIEPDGQGMALLRLGAV
jgi:hypothetical protein